MKKHNGIRPQDIVILLKIALLGNKKWYAKDLAYSLHISASEISESLHRSWFAGLFDKNKKKVMKKALIEFLSYGLRYVFPVKPGRIDRGIPTAHSAKPLRNVIASNEKYVWPSPFGKERGQVVEPLYSSVVKSVQDDEPLYELLALVDAVRGAGKAREREIAIKEIKKRLK